MGWSPWWDVGHFREYIGSIVEDQHGEHIMDFYRKYINKSHKEGEVTTVFPQGARFAVSKDTIRTRPKAEYEVLLETLSAHADPYAGYYMEWLWSELFLGHKTMCVLPANMERPVSHSDALDVSAKRFPQSSVQGEIDRKLLGISGSTLAPTASPVFVPTMTFAPTTAPTTAPTPLPTIQTTVTVETPRGSNTVFLADITGVGIGDVLELGSGSDLESHVITRVITGNATSTRRLATQGRVVLATPLERALSPGSSVTITATIAPTPAPTLPPNAPTPPPTEEPTKRPTSSPTAPPTEDDSPECFPGDTSVYAPQHARTDMAYLKVGDEALVLDSGPELTFERVYGFIHMLDRDRDLVGAPLMRMST